MAEAFDGEEIEYLAVTCRQLADEPREVGAVHVVGIGLLLGYVGWVGQEFLRARRRFLRRKRSDSLTTILDIQAFSEPLPR